jgi:hypothetical protein
MISAIGFSMAMADNMIAIAAVVLAALLIPIAWFLGAVPAAVSVMAYIIFVFAGNIQFSPLQMACFSLLSLMPFCVALSSALTKRTYFPALLAAVPGILLATFYAVFDRGIFMAVDFMSPVFVVLFSLLIMAPLVILIMWLTRKKAN